MTLTLRRTLPAAVLAASLAAGCGLIKSHDYDPEGPGAETQPLADARKGFQTKLVRRESAREPGARPPPNVFRTVQYESPAGKLPAYLTPDPKDARSTRDHLDHRRRLQHDRRRLVARRRRTTTRRPPPTARPAS